MSIPLRGKCARNPFRHLGWVFSVAQNLLDAQGKENCTGNQIRGSARVVRWSVLEMALVQLAGRELPLILAQAQLYEIEILQYQELVPG